MISRRQSSPNNEKKTQLVLSVVFISAILHVEYVLERREMGLSLTPVDKQNDQYLNASGDHGECAN